MAGSTNVDKRVTYRFDGDTSSLDAAIKNAVARIDALDKKLTSISAKAFDVGKQWSDSFTKSSAVAVMENTLTKIQATLANTPYLQLITPAQKTLLEDVENTLRKTLNDLNDFSKESEISAKKLTKVKTSITGMNKALRDAGIYLSDAQVKAAQLASDFDRIKVTSRLGQLTGDVKSLLGDKSRLSLLNKDQVKMLRLAKKELADSSKEIKAANKSGGVTNALLDKTNATVAHISQGLKAIGVDFKVVETEATILANEFDRMGVATNLRNLMVEIDNTLSNPRRLELLMPDQITMLQMARAELEACDIKLQNAASSGGLTEEALKEIEQTVHRINNGLTSTGALINKAEKSARNLSQTWASFVGKLALIRVATTYFSQVYSASADFVETINLFNVAVKDTRKEMTAFAEAMAEAYNTDVAPIYNSIGVFRQYANTLGFATRAADTFSDGLTKLNYDLASLYNVEYEEMATALKSGLAGQTKALMRYGISVHSATVQQTALNLGIKKSSTEWTTAERVALRYLSILEQTKNAHGDLARTIDSPINQFNILKAQLKILLRNIGSLVVLLAQHVLPVINALTIAFNKFLEVLVKAAGYEIEDYSDNLSPTNEMLGEIEDSAGDAEDAVQHLLAPLDEINETTPKDANIGLQGGMDPEIEAALRTYDNLMDQIYTKTDKLAEAFQGLFDLFHAQGLGEALKGVFDALKASIDVVAQALISLEPVLTPIFRVVSALLQSLGWLLSNIANPILKFIGSLTGQSGALFAAVALLNVAYATLTGNFKKLIAVKIIEWMATLGKKIWENIKFTIQFIAELLKERYEMIKNAIQTRIAAGAKWQLAIAAVAAAGAAALVIAGIVAAATTVAASTASSATSRNFTPGGAATGGVTTGPTLSWIGEGKYNEAVIPLERSPQFASMKEDIADSVYGKISRTPTYQPGQPRRSDAATVILNVNGKELARALLPDLGITRPQTGVKLA